MTHTVCFHLSQHPIARKCIVLFDAVFVLIYFTEKWREMNFKTHDIMTDYRKKIDNVNKMVLQHLRIYSVPTTSNESHTE